MLESAAPKTISVMKLNYVIDCVCVQGGRFCTIAHTIAHRKQLINIGIRYPDLSCWKGIIVWPVTVYLKPLLDQKCLCFCVRYFLYLA